jgi:opacity protein-like surface antigen
MQAGPALRLDTSLSGARTYALLAGELDYAFDKTVSALLDAGVGLGGGTPVRMHLGGRMRLADTGVPLTPFVQAQFGFGWLFDMLGANLMYFGVRLGAGMDYALTERWSTGVIAAFDLGGTTASRSAFFGTFDALAYASCTL